jgi:hypothetical protein
LLITPALAVHATRLIFSGFSYGTITTIPSLY